MALDMGLIILTLVIGLLIAVLVWSLTKKSTPPSTKGKNEKSAYSKKEGKKTSGMPSKLPKKKAAPAVSKDSKSTFTHSWLLTSLKGHTGAITDMDFSANGKHLATCAEDRSLMLWKLNFDGLDSSVVELNMNDIRTVRAHVQYDSATLIRWSPDSKALLTVRALGNNIEIYKVMKKPEAGGLPSVQPSHAFEKTREADLLAIDVASTGRFIMTCTPKNELDILDLKGNLLASIVTNQMETYSAKISPDGRFVATSGFTPEVRVWEVVFSRTGEFEKVSRAFELGGHTSGISSFDYSPDSGRMVSVSKDGTWRLYNTNIDYRQGQLATLLVSGKWKGEGSEPARIALAPDGRVVAIGSNSSLYIYSTVNAELLAHIPDVHSAPITRLRFDSTSRFILTTGDKYVRIFHNVAGFKIAVADLESKLKKTTGQAMKERCQIQLKEAVALVNLFNGKNE
ncbi:transducin beta-like protein 2 isoform X3 [Daphnia carinata]|uniref:transducin beta-like protein 2 isoform X3 n=1 Tax=Daphnia carinata TaxID=120202 RepID=UPI00257B2DE5|nr:transducin beta-like protein 2 isoform X3 [Daphnia carinata]